MLSDVQHRPNLGIFWFSQAFRFYGTITRAAQEGARAYTAPGCSSCAATDNATNAVNAVKATLSSANLDYNQAQWPAAHPAFNACPLLGGGSTNCKGAVSNKVCVQAPVQLVNTANGATGVCGVSVSFRYPLTFHMPFTSPTIYLTAQARVRMETQ